MLHFLLSAAVFAFSAASPDSIQIKRDTLLISFEGTSSNPTQNSLYSIYNLSKEVYRSKQIKLFLMPAYRRPSQERLTNDRLRELQKVLVQEGAELSDVFNETLDDERALALQRKDHSIFCLMTIESHPYRKVSEAIYTINQHYEPPDYDTLVNLASGIPIRLSHKIYMNTDTLPKIEQIRGNQIRQGMVSEEFEYLKDYKVDVAQLDSFSFLVPIPEGTSEKHMVVYRTDSVNAGWHPIKHGGKIAIGKTKTLLVPTNHSGIYRIGYISKTSEQSYVLSLPQNYGILDVALERKDGIAIPVQRVLGSNSMAFQLKHAPSEYLLNLQLLQSDGRIVKRNELELKACLKSKESDASLSGNAELRAIPGFRPPECRYRIPGEILQNNLVNR